LSVHRGFMPLSRAVHGAAVDRFSHTHSSSQDLGREERIMIGGRGKVGGSGKVRGAVLVGAAAIGIVALVGASAQGNRGLPEGRAPARLDPAAFTVNIDNPYYPLRPGDRRVYRETAPDGTRQRIVDQVTDQTKRIANGVEARVVIATVTNRRGKLVEYTEEWFAQDRAGNVWYFGEDTTSYEDGKASKFGSFEAGVNGAEPGVQMPAAPRAGMRYRLEGGYATGAADHTEVLSVGKEQVEVPFGHFRRTAMMRDFTPLEPRKSELWFYTKGVGAVLALDISDGDNREELVRFRRGG
jgi:hypothetical protein